MPPPQRGLFDACRTNSFAAHALGTGAFLFLFFGAILNIATCWAWIYMLLLSFVVGTLEAPTIMKLCENDTTKSITKVLEKVTGITRTLLYIGGCIPLLWCIDFTTVLAILLLFFSGFFYLADWLGPRGGDLQRTAENERKEELLLPENGEAPQDDGLPDWAPKDTASSESVTGAWNSFVETAAQKAVIAAAPAIATAAVSQMTNQVSQAQGNPFGAPPARQNQFSSAAPPSAGQTMTGDMGLAMTGDIDEGQSSKGNPFLS